jgi:hypothetical protein
MRDVFFLVERRLIAGKKQLCEIRQEDLENETVIDGIENRSSSTFLSLCDILQEQSDLRQLNIARKRRKTKQNSSQVGLSEEVSQSTQISFCTISPNPLLTIASQPPAPSLSNTQDPTSSAPTTTTIKSSRRIVSNASISDPTQNSAGGSRVWASNEKASDIFANNLIRHVISSIWPGGVILDWVQGRRGPTKLVWRSKYFPMKSLLVISVGGHNLFCG